jgi:hypothetical protein
MMGRSAKAVRDVAHVSRRGRGLSDADRRRCRTAGVRSDWLREAIIISGTARQNVNAPPLLVVHHSDFDSLAVVG